MANVGSLFVVLGLQASDYQNGLRKATKEANTAMNQIKREFASLNLKQAVVAVAALGTAFIYAGKKFADAANEADINKRRFNIMFGELAGSSKAWVDSYSKDIGRANDDLMGYMASFQMLLKNMGIGGERAAAMSKQMVKLGIDIGSFTGAKDAEVMDALTRAIAGQARGLVQYGIILKGVTQTDKDGNVVISDKLSKMSNAERTYSMFNALLRQTASIQGDASRNAGEYGNQLKRLQGNAQDLRQEIGERLKPAFTAMYVEMNKWLSDPKNIESMKKLGDEAARMTEKMAHTGEWAASHPDMISKVFYGIGAVVALNWLAKTAFNIKGITEGLIKLSKIPAIRIIIPEIIGLGAAIIGLRELHKLTGGRGLGNIIGGVPSKAAPIPYTGTLGAGGQDLMSKLIPFKPPAFDLFAGIKPTAAPEKGKSVIAEIDKAEKESFEYREGLARSLRDYQDMLGVRRMEEAAKQYEDGQKDYEDNNNKIIDFENERAKFIKGIRDNLASQEKMRIEQQKDAWIAFGDTIANTMMYAMQQSGNAFQNIAKAFEGMLVNMAAQYAARAAVFAMLNAISGGSFGGLVTASTFIFGNLGFKASGGPVEANRPYVVGEKRPELFVPKTAGTIIPSLSGMGTTNNTTDNSRWELNFHDSGSRQKMIGLPDEKFAEQFRRCVRDEKIQIKRLA